jgi:hydrogenase nickel incorporation protein HypB
MHEQSIVESLLALALEDAEKENASKIVRIYLVVGDFSGFVEETVDFYFSFLSKNTVADIEGDIASTIDADIINQRDIPAIQINTGGACHLDANMIGKALGKLDLEQADLVIIENVGNLVCPAEFALGAHNNVMLLSVPEGDDKPNKYPLMFTEANVVLVNKIDVLPQFDFDVRAFSKAVNGLNPSAKILPVSAKTGEGLEQWFSWLEEALKQI